MIREFTREVVTKFLPAQFPSLRCSRPTYRYKQGLKGLRAGYIKQVSKKRGLTVYTGLSTLPDNPGDSRFWTISPGLHIRVWNLPDRCQSLPFLVDSTFWQWNFECFALFELFYGSHRMFLHKLRYAIVIEAIMWLVGQMLQFQQHHLFCAFFLQMTSCAMCIMTSFIIPSPSVLNIWRCGRLTAVTLLLQAGSLGKSPYIFL